MVVRQLVVAKWGGELTRVGRAQAEDLGKRLRATMYPGDDEGGLLRLHSTFRHDLKIYTSDEGRCVKGQQRALNIEHVFFVCVYDAVVKSLPLRLPKVFSIWKEN